MVRKKHSVKTRISKTFYTQDTSCFFQFWSKTDPGKWQAETVWPFCFRSGLLHSSQFSVPLSQHPVIWECCLFRQAVKCCQTCVTNHFFAPTLCKLNSIFCRRNKSIGNFVARFANVPRAFGAHTVETTYGKPTVVCLISNNYFI